MRCYTFNQSVVYIYATGFDALIDVGTIPDGLGVFCTDVPWRISPRVAVSEGVLEEKLKVLETLLKGEGYRRVNVETNALEEYFVSGTEPTLPTATPDQIEETPTLHQWTHDNRPLSHVRVSLRHPSRRRRVPKPMQLSRTE